MSRLIPDNSFWTSFRPPLVPRPHTSCPWELSLFGTNIWKTTRSCSPNSSPQNLWYKSASLICSWKIPSCWAKTRTSRFGVTILRGLWNLPIWWWRSMARSILLHPTGSLMMPNLMNKLTHITSKRLKSKKLWTPFEDQEKLRGI